MLGIINWVKPGTNDSPGMIVMTDPFIVIDQVLLNIFKCAQCAKQLIKLFSVPYSLYSYESSFRVHHRVRVTFKDLFGNELF